MLDFRTISSLKPGDLYEMLLDSYSDLIEKYDPENKERYLSSWRNSDKLAFSIPVIGKCIFVSYLDDELAGFISYDPRNHPAFMVVGQNCILSRFKGKGLGSEQLSHLISFAKSNGYKMMRITTGDNQFFIPAQKMYQRAEFKETRRFRNDTFGYNEIEYELKF